MHHSLLQLAAGLADGTDAEPLTGPAARNGELLRPLAEYEQVAGGGG